MNKMLKIGAGLSFVLAALYVGDGLCYGIRKAYANHIKQVKNDAIEKTVDDFVTAVVTCRTVTIESKHHGKATVQLIPDN